MFFVQEPIVETATVQRALGPVHCQHDRVFGRIRSDGGLRAEHVRIDGGGHRWTAGTAQLRADVLHARGGRPAWADGVRRAGVAGVRPEPGAPVRVTVRRRFRRARARPTTGIGFVRGLLLRHRGTPLVRHDRTGEYLYCISVLDVVGRTG